MKDRNEEFVRHWISAQPSVAAFVSTMVPDYHAAEDVIQECAAILLRKFSLYQRERSFSSWAIGIARAEIFARRRQYLVKPLVFNDAALENLARASDDLGADMEDRLDAVRHCAEKVQGRAREFLTLRYGENLKPRDIAKRLGSTPGATRVALSRIRHSLRNCIDTVLEHGKGDTMDDLVSLSSSYIDDCLTPEEAAALRNAVAQDVESAKCVMRELMMHRRLYDIYHGESLLELEMEEDASAAAAPRADSDAWRRESIVLPAITADMEAEMDADEEIMAPPPWPAAKKPSRRRPWGKAAAAAMLLAGGIAAAVRLLRPAPVDATITRVIGASWDQVPSTAIPAELREGSQLSLRSGFCSMRFTDGTEVVLEGPARCTINAGNKIFLTNGKMTATMQSGMQGFVVQTSSGTISDLGTQFGVSVDSTGGGTEVDVFKGAVQVSASAEQSPGQPVASTKLAAGDLATLEKDSDAVHVNHGGSMPQRFVLSLSEDPVGLDAADLLSGGDGTTRLHHGAIDPSTGQPGTALASAHISDSIYHPVSSLPVVDGCFIPKGGLVQVNTAGDRFGFPMTDGTTADSILGTDQVPNATEMSLARVFGDSNSLPSKHRIVYLDANVGLTFNLAALRQLHPGLSLQHFHAIVGNVYVKSPKPVEIFILSGQSLRFHRLFQPDEVFTADVPLTEADQFLTIAATRPSRDGPGHNIVLGDAVFSTSAAK